jgi:hypothetical protein
MGLHDKDVVAQSQRLLDLGHILGEACGSRQYRQADPGRQAGQARRLGSGRCRQAGAWAGTGKRAGSCRRRCYFGGKPHCQTPSWLHPCLSRYAQPRCGAVSSRLHWCLPLPALLLSCRQNARTCALLAVDWVVREVAFGAAGASVEVHLQQQRARRQRWAHHRKAAGSTAECAHRCAHLCRAPRLPPHACRPLLSPLPLTPYGTPLHSPGCPLGPWPAGSSDTCRRP